MARLWRGPPEARPSWAQAMSERFEDAGQPRTGSPWREVDTGAGGPVMVCPGCWPDVAVAVLGRRGVEVRVVGERPEWARCAACDPEQVC